MLATIIQVITLACLWLCPSDAWIRINTVEWETHPPGYAVAAETPPPDDSPPPPRPSQPAPDSVEAWRPLVAAYWPADQVETALCVIWGESRGDPGADNPTSTARGLWQFLKGTWDKVAGWVDGPTYDSGAPYDPEISTRYAVLLWEAVEAEGGNGWGQWNAAARC